MGKSKNKETELSKGTAAGLLIKILNTSFTIGIITFMLLGTVIVVTQLLGVLTLNGPLTINISGVITKITFIVASITGLLGFVQGYIKGWNMED